MKTCLPLLALIALACGVAVHADEPTRDQEKETVALAGKIVAAPKAYLGKTFVFYGISVSPGGMKELADLNIFGYSAHYPGGGQSAIGEKLNANDLNFIISKALHTRFRDELKAAKERVGLPYQMNLTCQIGMKEKSLVAEIVGIDLYAVGKYPAKKPLVLKAESK